MHSCEEPLNFITFDVLKDNFQLHLGATGPWLEKYEDLRPNMALMRLIPEGAQRKNIDLKDFPSKEIDPIRQYIEGDGDYELVGFYQAPKNLSTCDFIENESYKKSMEPKDGRCHFWEPWSKTDYAVLFDKNETVAEKGNYILVSYLQENRNGKYFLLCSLLYYCYHCYFISYDNTDIKLSI